MATLVLTTVGTLVGGPIGGAIGAVIGSQIDSRVLAPRRHGPRLGDLTVQTSRYGSWLPKLFGTMRVAGTVIWATDLREDRHRSSGGKGGGKSTTYSYSASFAVALSARPIRAVGRIWADGKLLRGSAGDWKSETGFRLHLGDEEQTADPLIASAEGIDAAPAYRGVAYAVFETMQLADYGNRIPSLTFEVIADEGAVAITAIAAALSDGAIDGASADAVSGFAASGDSARGVLEALGQAYPLRLRDDGLALSTQGADVTIDAATLGTAPEGKRSPRIDRARRATGVLPDEVTLSHYEPSRDYQAGLQRARRDGIGARILPIELPAAISADGAKGLAEAALTRAWAERATRAARLPWRYLGLRAGDALTIGADRWTVAEWSLEHMVLALRLRAARIAPIAVPATAGRAINGADEVAGATIVMLLDLPALDGAEPTAPQMWIAAAGTQPGWRRAEISYSADGGASWQNGGRTALPATIGQVVGTLASGPRELVDHSNVVEIELAHGGMALASGGEDALANGANLASIGDELIQFGQAEQLTPTRWRLSVLLRGRRGTDWAIDGHAGGESFVLIEAATLRAVDLSAAAIGSTIMVRASGPGDGSMAADASLPLRAAALRPPAPIAFDARRQDDGAIRFTWTRRSRIDWSWRDGLDAPAGEDGERYRLTIAPTAGSVRTIETPESAYDYTAAEQVADGAVGATMLMADLRQIGARAISDPPATGSWTI